MVFSCCYVLPTHHKAIINMYELGPAWLALLAGMIVAVSFAVPAVMLVLTIIDRLRLRAEIKRITDRM